MSEELEPIDVNDAFELLRAYRGDHVLMDEWTDYVKSVDWQLVKDCESPEEMATFISQMRFMLELLGRRVGLTSDDLDETFAGKLRHELDKVVED